MTKARRQPQRKYTGRIRKGATATPTDEPLSYSAAASPRSRLGNNSETALIAPGQLEDSTDPIYIRNRAKLELPVAIANKTDTIEYHISLPVRTHRELTP